MTALRNDTLLQDGKYLLKQVLGHGGFGITYYGVHTGLNRSVAIKEFFINHHQQRLADGSVKTIASEYADEVALNQKKFKREAQLIAELERTPHVVDIYDVFEENNTVYYVMEYIEGGSLKQLVDQSGSSPLSDERALRLAIGVGEALCSLHEHRIMHLDVKPANVMLRTNGDTDDVVLIDFGLSKHYDNSGHQTESVPLGISNGFAPIEQYQPEGLRRFTPTADVYSLGALLYYLCTGQRPPDATFLTTHALQKPMRGMRQQTDSLPFSSDMSQGVWAIVSRAMQTHPEQRYQSMEAMLSDLRRQLAVSENNAQKTGSSVVTSPCDNDTAAHLRPVATHWKSAVMVAIAAIVVLLLVLLMTKQCSKIGSRDPVIEEATVVMPEKIHPIRKDIIDSNGNKICDVYAYVNGGGKLVSGYQWKQAGGFRQGAALAEDFDGRKTYLNAAGQAIITPEVTSAWHFFCGRGSYKKGDNYGAIDKYGNVKIDFKYKWLAFGYDDGVGVMRDETNLLGLIDTCGREIQPCQWTHINLLGEYLAYVKTGNASQLIHADSTGAVVKAMSDYSMVHELHEGMAVCTKNGLSGYITKDGDVVSPCKWKNAREFSHGLAAVRNDSIWGYLDKKGNVAIQFKFRWADSFSEGLAAAALYHAPLYGYIGTSGNFVLEPQWVQVRGFHQGLAATKKEGKWGYIDKNGSVVIKHQYNEAEDFDTDGLAWVRNDSTWVLINSKGETPFVR
ncbi:MAG: WG repeat-containing protein [Prevotella sp.]|nr:WG repeat-containing protein [Prevotella sp.]